MDSQAPVTEKLGLWAAGDEAALAELMDLVYAELRNLARRALSRERRRPELDTNLLIHETFLRFLKLKQASWANRSAFFAFAARQMRNILVDEARRRRAQRRGSGVEHVEITTSVVSQAPSQIDVLIVDELLERLEQLDPRGAQIVEMKLFAGMTEAEIAEVLAVSRATVQRDWRVTRRWLAREYFEGSAG